MVMINNRLSYHIFISIGVRHYHHHRCHHSSDFLHFVGVDAVLTLHEFESVKSLMTSDWICYPRPQNIEYRIQWYQPSGRIIQNVYVSQ